uniref:Threonylcarbamoyl-AMP synthase n=1 Tax=Cyanistes caeruleus TaxID=156563 RepID=A0A8C0UVM6_CYACU
MSLLLDLLCPLMCVLLPLSSSCHPRGNTSDKLLSNRYCHVNVPDELLRDLLPGPVTLVLQRSEELNKDLNPFTSLVGVRIPNHPFMRDLARACSGPLALTSANISSQGSTLTVPVGSDTASAGEVPLEIWEAGVLITILNLLSKYI